MEHYNLYSSPLFDACYMGDVRAVRECMESGMHSLFPGARTSYLEVAIRGCHLEVAKVLIHYNHRILPAHIQLANALGYRELAMYLALVHSEDNAIFAALEALDETFLREILAHSACKLSRYIHGTGKTILHLVTELGNLDLFKILLEFYPDLDEITLETNETACHIAARLGWIEILRYLICGDFDSATVMSKPTISTSTMELGG